MAVAYQTSTTRAWTTGTITLNKPSGTTTDDLLIAILGLNDATTNDINSAPSGWTLIYNTPGTDNNTRLVSYRKRAGGSEPASYDWSVTGGNWAGIMIRIDGQTLDSAVNPINASDEGISNNNATGTYSSGITPAFANSLLVMAIVSVTNSATGHSAQAITTDNPTWTERAEVGPTSNATLSVSTALRSQTTATGNWTATVGGGGTTDSVSHLLAITPSVSATVPAPDPVTLALSVPPVTPTGGATVTSPNPILLSLSLPTVTPTADAPKWVNTDKSTPGAVANTDKS